MSDYDAIILGAGHNGLTAANVLGKEGARVLVLEKSNFPGGMAATKELFPGHKHSVGAWTFILYRPEMLEKLELSNWGFELIDQWASFCSFGEPDDPPFIAYNDPERMLRHLMEDHGPEVMASAGSLFEHLSMFGPYFESTLHTQAPSIHEVIANEPDAKKRQAMSEMWFGSAMQTVSKFFPDPDKGRTIQGSIAAMTIDSTYMGPWTPGSGASMLYHYLAGGVANSFKMPKGGIGSLSSALARRGESFGGVEIAYKKQATAIIVENGRAVGVELKDGTRISSQLVLSSVDARTTYLDLLGEQHLPSRFARSIREISYANGYLQVHMTLHGEPDWKGHLEPYLSEPHVNSTMAYIPSAEHVSDAWESYRKGQLPEAPPTYLYVPSLVDSSMAPPGKHTGTIFMPYFPHDLPSAEHKVLKEQYADRGLAVLERFAPGLRDLVDQRVVFSNQYFANTFGISGGDFAHGLLHPGQMWDDRPVAGQNDYITPVEGLYLCGAGTNPGPGVTSLPGWNGAHVALEALALRTPA